MTPFLRDRRSACGVTLALLAVLAVPAAAQKDPPLPNKAGWHVEPDPVAPLKGPFNLTGFVPVGFQGKYVFPTAPSAFVATNPTRTRDVYQVYDLRTMRPVGKPITIAKPFSPFMMPALLLVRRTDLEAVQAALAAAGFEFRHAAGIDLFVDGPDGKARDGVHLIFDGETVRPGEPLPNPAVTESVAGGEFRVLNLRALVQIKLTAYRDKDRTHLRDLLEVGLVDGSWLQHYPPELADRLRALIETPEG